jgi:hypothetical protein
MTSTVDKKTFLVAMSRLASNHTGIRAHLQRINVIQDAFCQCGMGYDTIDHGLWECGVRATRKAPGIYWQCVIWSRQGSFLNTQRTWVCTSSQMPSNRLRPI